MRELVPIRNTPPLFASELRPVELTAANATTAIATTTGAGHHFLISASWGCSCAERRFFEGEVARIRVERIPDTEREGSQVLPVPERELVEHGYAERLEVLFEDVLERAGAGPVRGLPLVAPVAVLHLPHDHAGRLLQLSGVRELGQEAVDVVRGRLHVLEEQDRALDVDLPRSPHRLHQQPEAASDERRGHLAAVERPDVRIVRIARDLA